LEKKEVIKHSGAIQVSANQISLLQRKIWNVLLANAFDDLLSKDEYSIKIKDLAEILKFDSNDIELVKEAVTKMQKVLVQWNVLEKDDEAWISSQFLGEVNITKQSGVIWYTWGKYLREKLCNPTMYAKINLAIQSRFKSKYSLVLYELCVDYFIKKQGKGETPWINIEDFKKLMGVENDKYCQEYKRLNDFVIKKAVKEVNEKSDIFVAIDVKKEARKVVALKFHIAPTPRSNNLLTRLIKAPKQGELSFKPEDEEKKELYERMTRAFTLSDRQAQEILSTMHDFEEVKEILDMVERRIKRNEIMNIGAYTYKALKDQYQPRKSIIAIEREQEAEARVNEEKRKAKEKEIINGLTEEYEGYKIKTTKEYISGLSKDDQEVIKKKFEESLDDFLKNKYRESGLESPIISASYIKFLSTKYLKNEMLDFHSFAQERGFLLEQDKEGWKMVNIKEMLLQK
jgi:plasmid replication initiation protein